MSLNLSKTFGLIRPMTRSLLLSTSTLTRFAVNGVEAALALDFIGSEYRTGNAATTFADAFMGNSPRLTYNPGSASSSQSTMTNSSGHLVWAPHNLVTYSNDLTSWSNAWSGGVTLTPDDIVGPDGVNSLAKLARIDSVADAIFTSFGLTAGLTYTVSFVAKAGTSTSSQVFFYDLGALGTSSELTFSWGSPPTTTSSTNATNIDYADLGGGFYRISFSMVPNTTASHRLVVAPANTGTSNEYIHFGQVAVYRSDLGGMAPVPGAATGFETYVPTNGNAEYLPRVGHHVYNGSTWVNEGLLIESEARTNLITHSEDFTDASWTLSNSVIVSTNNSSPDGAYSAIKLRENTNNEEHSIFSVYTWSLGVTYTLSVFAKAAERSVLTIGTRNNAAELCVFDLSTGSVATEPTGYTGSIEGLGGGWFRCSVVHTDNGTAGDFFVIGMGESTSSITYTGGSSDGVYIYGAQVEQGSTPSSYIPTNGSTVIRGGQSLTVPPAEFGWPEPEYIGPDLVVEGSHTSIGSDWSYANGVYTSSGEMTALQTIIRFDNIGIEEGKVYSVLLDIANRTAGDVSVKLNGGDITPFSTNGTHTATLVGLNLDGFQLIEQNGFDGDVSNISVREINPLSVSFQMDGRMTYADEGVTGEVRFFDWVADGSNSIRSRMDTTSGSGLVLFRHAALGTVRTSISGGSVYSPGVNVPFNIASRYGSTFVRGSTDGTLQSLDTTPTALPDLSGSDLRIANSAPGQGNSSDYPFMGTIGQFRQFAGDIGDAGLVTATNPSTEPTLSLTFDGTGGSFYNLNWSE